MAAILKLSICPHDVQSVGEVHPIIGVGHLSHDIQAVPHHHRALHPDVDDDGLEPRYNAFIGE